VNVHEFDFELEDEEDDQSRIHLIAFDDINLGTERRYLVKGLIPRTGLIVVWGPPKSGKSFVVFDLVMHIALDWRYRGHRVHPGFVVYCAFEGQMGFEAFRREFLTSNKGSVPFYLQPVTLDLVNEAPDLTRVIRRTLGGVNPVVIVLDTLNRSLRSSESSDEDMPAYVRAADSLREAFDCRSPGRPTRSSPDPRHLGRHRHDHRIHARGPVFQQTTEAHLGYAPVQSRTRECGPIAA
jgi:RecA-family ATPase